MAREQPHRVGIVHAAHVVPPARGLRLAMNGEANVTRLRQLHGPYLKGPCPVSIDYRNGKARCELWLGEQWSVSPDDRLVRALHDWLRPDNVQFVY
jgi:DNA polymerase-3 subunit alpha